MNNCVRHADLEALLKSEDAKKMLIPAKVGENSENSERVKVYSVSTEQKKMREKRAEKKNNVTQLVEDALGRRGSVACSPVATASKYFNFVTCVESASPIFAY